MNEKLQYASMIEIPVNTCNITYKPLKKKRKKRISEDIKQDVIEKVNSDLESSSENTVENAESYENFNENTVKVYSANPKKKFKFKLTAVSVQIMVIGVLIATIFLTNAFNANSRINTFFKGVFGTEQEVVADARLYSDFAPTLTANDGAVITSADGVIVIEQTGSVYSACNGTVKSVTLDEETKKYTVKVSHSDNFTSVYVGLDFAYAEEGASVYYNVPLGYTKDQVELCFYSGDAVITDYQLVEDSVVWAV